MKFGFIARHRDKLQLGECQILKRKKNKDILLVLACIIYLVFT